MLENYTLIYKHIHRYARLTRSLACTIPQGQLNRHEFITQQKYRHTNTHSHKHKHSHSHSHELTHTQTHIHTNPHMYIFHTHSICSSIQCHNVSFGYATKPLYFATNPFSCHNTSWLCHKILNIRVGMPNYQTTQTWHYK